MKKPSTGYSWHFTSDDSGVYEVVETVTLHASTKAEGVPGKMIWKFKAVRPGNGSALFELLPPESDESAQKNFIKIAVT